jgi:hypothetical protein
MSNCLAEHQHKIKVLTYMWHHWSSWCAIHVCEEISKQNLHQEWIFTSFKKSKNCVKKLYTFGLRSLPLFFNTVSSDTLPCPFHVFFFAHHLDQELCSELAFLTVSFTTGCNGHTLDTTGLQYYRLSLVSRYNCCILCTFGTPQHTLSPTIYYAPPRFI